MGLLQEMVTAARKLKADNGLDDKMELAGVLYCRNGSSNVELPVLERLGKVKLEVRTGAAPALTGAVRSTPHFDLSLQLPEVDREACAQRLLKENDKLEKLILNIDRPARQRKILERRAASHRGRILRCQTGRIHRSDSEKSRHARWTYSRFDLACDHKLPDRRIEWHTTIGSTMTEASRLAASGAPSGTVVGAEEQTAGQGRHGRSWHSEPGSGLYVSIILRHQFTSATLTRGHPRAWTRGPRGDPQATDLACDLRWPNDVLIESKKCAGILTQLEGSAIIAGIGINVNHSRFPEELAASRLRCASPAAGFIRASGCCWNCSRASTSIATLLEKHGRGPIIEMFSAHIQLRYRPPRVCGSRRLDATRHHGRPQRIRLPDAPGRRRSKKHDRRGRSAPVLLALDAGNSNITIGAFEETKLIGRWRLRTIHEQTADEWGVLMRNLFALASLDLARVDGIIIASVVPTLDARCMPWRALFSYHAAFRHARNRHRIEGALR